MNGTVLPRKWAPRGVDKSYYKWVTERYLPAEWETLYNVAKGRRFATVVKNQLSCLFGQNEVNDILTWNRSL